MKYVRDFIAHILREILTQQKQSFLTFLMVVHCFFYNFIAFEVTALIFFLFERTSFVLDKYMYMTLMGWGISSLGGIEGVRIEFLRQGMKLLFLLKLSYNLVLKQICCRYYPYTSLKLIKTNFNLQFNFYKTFIIIDYFLSKKKEKI